MFSHGGRDERSLKCASAVMNVLNIATVGETASMWVASATGTPRRAFMITMEQLRSELNRLHGEGMGWREIALLPAFRGVAFGTLNAIANGREPKEPRIRAILGLPQHESCGYCWTFNKYVRKATGSRPKRWRDMPISTLRVALQYREELV